MKTRCLNKNHVYYRLYGGRGITICERWLHSFENFLADMGARPDAATLDRIDRDKGYSPENCRWADRKTQSENSVNTIWVEHMGERCSLSEWARRTGISFSVLWQRHSSGWPPDELLAKKNFQVCGSRGKYRAALK